MACLKISKTRLKNRVWTGHLKPSVIFLHDGTPHQNCEPDLAIFRIAFRFTDHIIMDPDCVFIKVC